MTAEVTERISLWFQGRATAGLHDGLGPVPVELTFCDLHQLLLPCGPPSSSGLRPLEGGPPAPGGPARGEPPQGLAGRRRAGGGPWLPCDGRDHDATTMKGGGGGEEAPQPQSKGHPVPRSQVILSMSGRTFRCARKAPWI